MRMPSLVVVAILSLMIDTRSSAHADDHSSDAIRDSDLRTTVDLLRGFNDEELADAQRAIPPRREPRLGLPRPRLVTVTGRVYEDTNANGKRDANRRF